MSKVFLMGKIRVRASTLMETLVATVLIVIIFMMASMLLNSIFASSLKANLQPIYAQLQKVEYQYKNGQIDAPYFEEWESWEIEIQKETKSPFVLLQAKEMTTERIVRFKLINGEQ